MMGRVDLVTRWTVPVGPWARILTAAALAALLAASGCKEGDVDVHFDGSLFDDEDEDGGLPEAGADAATPDAGLGDDEDAGDGDGDGGDGGAGSGDDGQPGPEDWPRLLAEASCQALEDCLGADLMEDVFAGRDCVALRENVMASGDLRSLPEAAEAGRLLFLEDGLATCLADVRMLGCAVGSARLPASCDLALIGNVPLGGDCVSNEECEGEAFCDKGDPPTCPGYCAPLQGEDMPCKRNDDDQCQDGLVCFEGSCKPLRGLAQDCGDGLPQCEPGLVCLGEPASCQTIDSYYFKQSGESCEPGVELCQPGLSCVSLDATTGMCAERVEADAACRRGAPNPCPSYQYCDAQAPGEFGTCQDNPSDGEPCLPENRRPRCADQHACVDGTCVMLKQNGEACDDYRECYSSDCGNDGRCEGSPVCEP